LWLTTLNGTYTHSVGLPERGINPSLRPLSARHSPFISDKYLAFSRIPTT